MKNSPTRVLLTFLFLFALLSANGQKEVALYATSLEEFKTLQSGQERFTHFLNSENKYEDNSIDDWLNLVDDHLVLAERNDDVFETRMNLLIKAHLNYDSGCSDKSVFIAEKLHQNIAILNDQMKKALLNLLDLSYSKLGFYDKQIAVRREKFDFGFIGSLCFHDIYANLGYYHEAYTDFINHEKRLIDEKDFFAQADFYIHAGHLLRLDKNYSSALNHLEKALGYSNLYINNLGEKMSEQERSKTKLLEGRIKANIGKCYSGQNEDDKAITYLEEGIALIQEYPSTATSSELIEGKIELVHCYLKRKNYEKAGMLLESGIGPLTIPNKIRLNRLNATYFNKIGNSNKSVLFFEKNDRIIDSISSATTQTHVQQLNALVGAEKKNAKLLIDEQLELVERQKADIANKDSRFNKVTIFTLVMLLAFGGLFWAYLLSVKNHRLITEQKHYIQAALIEKDSMLKEIHHRVKNNLQIVSSLLRQQAKNTASEEVVAALEEGRIRVKAMALIHQQLYQHDDISVIDMQGYIESLINSVQSVYKRERNNVNISIDAKDVELDLDRAIPFGLMLNELVSNSYKYAFSETEDDGEINIHLSSTPEKGGYFEYVDNGIGMPANNEDSTETTMGIRLIKRLANQLKSTLKIDNNSDGVRFYFNFS